MDFVTKNIKLILIGLLLLGLFVVIFTFLSKSNSSSSNSQSTLKDARLAASINQEFSFPLKDETDTEVSKIKYTLESAELRSEILVKGQKATAVKGREFLIISLKITNEFSQAIELNTRDYVRLSVNGNREEWLAPDIHNDPVEIQAASTKMTRIGFPVNTDDKDMLLRIGEIEGDKEEVSLDFKK